jgi:hypothetical protein
MADLEEERSVNVSFAMFLVDYNAVESVLLACAVLVNLSGIMFLSNRFNDAELIPYYEDEYTQLAIAVATLILLSVFYFFILLCFEIFFMLNPERAAWCVAFCTSRAKREKLAKKVSGDDDKTKASAAAGGKAAASGEIHMQQSVLVTTQAGTDEGRAATASGVLDSEEPPSKLQWGVVRSHAKQLQGNVDELRDEIRKLKKAAHGEHMASSMTAGSMRHTSAASGSRTRTFGPRQVRGKGTGSSSNPLFKAAAAAAATSSSSLSGSGKKSSRKSLVPMRSSGDMSAMVSPLVDSGSSATPKPDTATTAVEQPKVTPTSDGMASNPLAAGAAAAAAGTASSSKKKGNKRLFKDPELPSGWIGVEKTKDDGSKVIYYWNRQSNKTSKTKPSKDE